LILGITGHRLPSRLSPSGEVKDWFPRLQHTLRFFFLTHTPAHVITGMAVGTDWCAATVAQSLGIPYTCAIPWFGYERLWPEVMQPDFHNLVRAAAAVIYVSEAGEVWARWKLEARNQWIVDHCDVIAAIWDGGSGGTANTVRYAHTQQRPIVRLDTRTYLWEGEAVMATAAGLKPDGAHVAWGSIPPLSAKVQP